MRFAYADPPYPGQAKRWYGDHPDYAGEVDHAELIARLERDYPDGWALSTSAAALRDVLGLCPQGARLAVWHKPDSEAPGFRNDWHLCWEPVIVSGGRTNKKVRNLLTAPAGVRAQSIPGQKPPAFSRWVFALLGAELEDTLDDLFPGSGAVSREWDAFQSQPMLPTFAPDKNRRIARVARDLRQSGAPDLWSATT